MILAKNMAIGMFDSGLGGVSVLAKAVKMLPQESFLYYGDSAHAPYGEKDEKEIKRLSIEAAEFLIEKGIKALVVACNTATSVAIEDLRKRFSFPVIGMEPALKPAVEIGPQGKIVVMATPVTLQKEKFLRLLGKFQDQRDIIPLPCPGLAELIERGCCSGTDIENYLEDVFHTLKNDNISIIVLGCTHYVFIKKEVKKFMPGAQVLDGNFGTVKHLEEVLRENDLISDLAPDEQRIKFFTSADPAQFMPLYHQLLSRELENN
ncbi:MAG: glutamate racemase [Desulfitobacteriaceae bacterium]|nr:glutamate racemase [Desulfitobacteriaceae bacterium]MDD4751642.1 glutamate racemase [Desulfitobacteriaceae bacterium]